MAEERKPCANPDCGNDVGSQMDFCFTCNNELRSDADKLAEDLDKLLALEAEFVAFCIEHGLPHPHE